MSAALAIAATSEVLRYVVSDALVRAASTLNFTAPGVNTGAPPRPDQQANTEPPSVNLFLMQVTPNPAGRNMMGPTRDAQGRRLNNAPLILDLHYLLSAHGPEVIREIGLGTAVHALHQAGIVPRELIRRALKTLENDPDANKKAVAKDRLADQLDCLTITAESLDIDALTKIWTATQAPYRPSIGILVTTVFLEDVRASHEPMPVTQPAALTPVSVRELAITAVHGVRAGARWPITVEADIFVGGAGFADSSLTAKLGGASLAIVAAESGPTSLTLRFVPATIASLRSGPQLLELAISQDIGGRSTRIQVAGAAVVLHPAITVPANQVVPDSPADPGAVTGPLDVQVSPPVTRTQGVRLVLTPLTGGTDQSIAWVPPAGGLPTDTVADLSFKLNKVPKGGYLVRLSVDGTVSPAMPDVAGQFQPQVTL